MGGVGWSLWWFQRGSDWGFRCDFERMEMTQSKEESRIEAKLGCGDWLFWWFGKNEVDFLLTRRDTSSLEELIAGLKNFLSHNR